MLWSVSIPTQFTTKQVHCIGWVFERETRWALADQDLNATQIFLFK